MIEHDWEAIQKAYDQGLSQRELIKLFGISFSKISDAIACKKLVTRTSEQTFYIKKLNRYSVEDQQKI